MCRIFRFHKREWAKTVVLNEHPDNATTEIAEMNIHAFIIKIWFEGRAQRGRKVVWRGHITHVLEGKRQFFDNLGDISVFIVPYLNNMGVKLSLRGQIRHWFTQWKMHLRQK
jgi:hypothetical protein